MNEASRINVGGWTVIAEQNLLERDGRSFRLEPRAIELLVYLAQRPGQVISTDELIATVWHGRVVEENAIYKRINELRKAFGDDAREPRFIETIPKRGYRLVAAVAPSGPRSPDLVVTKPSPRAERLDPRRRLGARAAYVAGSGIVITAVALLAWRSGFPPVVSSAPQPAAPKILQLTADGGLKEVPRLSPDGEMVVFSWSGAERRNWDIYVKATQPDAQVIRVTEDPAIDSAPVWSPDGRQIAFFRNAGRNTDPSRGELAIWVAAWPGGQLRKIADVAGLSDYQNHRIATVSWSSDGRFLIFAEKPSLEAPTRIVRADVDTGEKRALTELSLATNVIGDLHPTYAPDGRIAFVRAPATYSTLDVWVMDGDGNNQRQLTTGRWSHVETLSWLPDGTEVLFTAGDVFSRRSYSVRLDGAVPWPLPGLGENDRFAQVQAGRLVFAKYVMPQLRLWQVPGRKSVDRNAPQQDLRNGAKLVYTPAGDKIAWITDGGTGRAQIRVADTDAVERAATIEMQTDAFNPAWSPDGKYVVFDAHDNGNSDVYLYDVARKGRPVPLTTHSDVDMYPTFAHDGRWIYFSSKRSGVFEIYRMLFGGNEADAVAVTVGGGINGFESADGYLYYEHAVTRNAFTQPNGPIWRIPVDRPAEPEEILKGWPRIERSWVLADNGIYFLVSRDQPNFAIRYLDLVSREISDVYGGQGPALYPGVSPDERTLVFSRQLLRSSELWLMENFSH